MVLVLSTSSDSVLHLYQGSTLEWSQMLTDGHKNIRKTGSLYGAMPEADATKRI